MNTKRENVIAITEFIVNSITVTAMFFLLVTTISMIEAWSISGVPLVVFLICIAWFGIITAYKNVIKK